jgi:anti-sigma factor RsiW
LAQALAYVDECLAPEERRDFERQMAGDSGLAARVEQWRAQNKAIRKVFSENWHRREQRDNGDFEPPARRIDLRAATRREGELARGPRQIECEGSPAQRVISERSASRAPIVEAWLGRFARLCCVLLSAVLFCVLSATPAPPDRSRALTSAAFSAYWTFGGAKRMDFATGERAALERWLQPRLGVVVIPDFSAAGFALLGGRVIPGAEGPAAFALYENASGSRIGLAFEPGETTPASRSFVRISGDLIAVALPASGPGDLTIVGKPGAGDLTRLVQLARSAAPSPQ